MKSIIFVAIFAVTIPLNSFSADTVSVRVSITIPELPKITQNTENENKTTVAGDQNESPSRNNETVALALRDNQQVLLKTNVPR